MSTAYIKEVPSGRMIAEAESHALANIEGWVTQNTRYITQETASYRSKLRRSVMILLVGGAVLIGAITHWQATKFEDRITAALATAESADQSLRQSIKSLPELQQSIKSLHAQVSQAEGELNQIQSASQGVRELAEKAKSFDAMAAQMTAEVKAMQGELRAAKERDALKNAEIIALQHRLDGVQQDTLNLSKLLPGSLERSVFVSPDRVVKAVAADKSTTAAMQTLPASPPAKKD